MIGKGGSGPELGPATGSRGPSGRITLVDIQLSVGEVETESGEEIYSKGPETTLDRQQKAASSSGIDVGKSKIEVKSEEDRLLIPASRVSTSSHLLLVVCIVHNGFTHN